MKKQDINGKYKTYPYLIVWENENNKLMTPGRNGWRDLNRKELTQYSKGDYKNDGEESYEDEHPHENPNLICDCGNKTFEVCWWDYPYTGGFCKIVCSNCKKKLILINDYS